MHSYWAKVAVLWAVVFVVFLICRVEFFIPFPQWTRHVPRPLIGFAAFLMVYGLPIVSAVLLAGIWQLVQRR